MILHILGGGAGQLNAIRHCRSLGITTLVTDMDLSAPGCVEADFCAEASTFDAEATAEAVAGFSSSTGRKVDAVLVTATDQPVLTAAVCADKLGIPYFLDPETALGVTNKKIMKNRLRMRGVPVADFRFIEEAFSDEELSGLSFPVVVKPLDSQGQRGVYRLNSIPGVRDVFAEVRSFGSCPEILVEEYLPSDEITVSGWLEDGSLSLLSVTDRVTIDNPPGIGVCIAHHYPSKHSSRLAEITELTRNTAEALGLLNGPVYFQFLLTGDPSDGSVEIVVNEAAARLGGAYEDLFIPRITGIDILDIIIRMSCGLPYDSDVFNKLRRDCTDSPAAVISLQMFFCSEGVIESLEGMDQLRRMPGVVAGEYLLKPGTHIRRRMNSTQRAGYFIVEGGTKDEVNGIVQDAYSLLKIAGADGENLIEYYDKMLFGGNK